MKEMPRLVRSVVLLGMLALVVLAEGGAQPSKGGYAQGEWVCVSCPLVDVVYGNGTFVAVGEWGAVYTSPDGVHWTPQRSGTSAALNGVTYGNGTFVAVGTGGVLTSPDGVHWTKHTLVSVLGFTDVVYGNGIFVVVGPEGVIFISPAD